jgi:hypothetical protein
MLSHLDQSNQESHRPIAGLERLAQISSEAPIELEEEVWSDEVLQSVLAKAIKMYAHKFESGSAIDPYSDHTVQATSVLILCTMLLKKSEIELFELGMWQSFSGIK